jgi:hypothetical protein
MIMNQCSYFPAMGLMQFGPVQQQVVRSVYDIFIHHLGARMAVPVLLWILICFRRDDLEKILGLAMPLNVAAQADRASSVVEQSTAHAGIPLTMPPWTSVSRKSRP